MKRKEQLVKADDFVIFEGSSNKEKFTYFEELEKKVEVLIETVNELTEVLRFNNLIRIKEVIAPYFEEDEVYRKLGDKINE